MKKILLLFVFINLSIGFIFSATFTSNVATGLFNSNTSWTFTGIDTDGIPDKDDDVTILSGHNISAGGYCYVRNITVQGTLTGGSSTVLYIYGNYSVSGIETGVGAIAFMPGLAGLTISGSGTFSPAIRYTFAANSHRTISAGTTITKANNTITGIANTTLTNLGNVTFSTVNTNTGAHFINSANANLTLLTKNFMSASGTFFTASASGNTVNLKYPTGNVPNTVNGYYNLSIAGTVAGAKTLTINTTVLNNLTINSTNTLNTNNFDLIISGNYVNNGTFTGSSGKSLTFNGSASQTLSGNGSSSFQNIVIDNSSGVTITNGTYTLAEVLTINNGNFTNSGGSFTLLSTDTKTARIAPVTSGGFAGNFTVQRFITARDTTWSILSSPVQSTTMQDWDNELFIYYSTDYYQATTASYDETTASYLPVSSASKTISPMEGFEVYLLGDFSFSSIGNTTLNSIGVPNFGDQSMGLDYTAGSGYEGQNLVGNPFASSIDWSTVYSASSNIDNYADIYDYTTGNYASINLGDEIGSGQGFWVYALGAGATLNIPESAKTTSSNSSLRKAETPVFNLSIASADGSHSFAHRLELLGDMSYSNQKDANDRPYRMSPNKKAPKITSLIDGKEFIRNAFNSDAAVVNLPLLVSVGLDGKYSISAQNMEALAGGYTCIVLKDNKLNQSINLNEAGSYTFIATTKDAKDRFELELSKNGNCRSVIALSNVNIEDQVLVLPTTNGNSIAFNFTETLNTTVYVTNMLGQSIVEPFNVQANTQTIELGIPEDFSGMYILTISNEKGMVSKKFVKK